jgi:transposase
MCLIMDHTDHSGVCAQHVDVEMSCTGILRMLWRLCLSYTGPTYVLAKADPEKQQAFEQEIHLIKKTSE